MRRGPRHLAHTATTAALAASYPFIAEGGLGTGCYIGLDVYGGASPTTPGCSCSGASPPI
jgi:hypothetical protein